MTTINTTENSSNVTNLVDNFVAQLNQQADSLTASIVEIDTEYKAKLKGLTEQLDVVTGALARITGKPVKAAATPGTRKPMSAEGKENIRKGLQAHRERLAAEATAKAAEAVPVPSAATESASAAPEAMEPTTEAAHVAVVKPKGRKGGKNA